MVSPWGKVLASKIIAAQCFEVSFDGNIEHDMFGHQSIWLDRKLVELTMCIYHGPFDTIRLLNFKNDFTRGASVKFLFCTKCNPCL